MSSEYRNDSLCEGCDNPGCRHGGCQGRKPKTKQEFETAYCTDLSKKLIERELDPNNFFSLPKG